MSNQIDRPSEAPPQAAAGRPAVLALIEPNAGRQGGHWAVSLVALARAGSSRGSRVVVIALNGVHATTREAIEAAGAHVLDRPAPADIASRLWLLSAKAFHKLTRAAFRLGMSRAVQQQFTLASRSMVEIASLRVAARQAGPSAPIVSVILTASEGLAGFTVRMSRQPHVRSVHEVDATEGRVLRRVERCFVGSRQCVTAVCTTAGVEEALLSVAPGVPTTVAPFALIDGIRQISDAERVSARARFGLQDGVPTAALVGGWWSYKDIPTVERALAELSHPLALIVAGSPVEPAGVARLDSLPFVSVTALLREVDESELREVYAAADFTIVSRVRGVTKESGLIMDAARYGVPLLTSDNDLALTRRLEGEPWVEVFATGDAASLSAAIARVAADPLSRPDAAAARRIGLRTAAETLDQLYAVGAETTRRCPW